MMRPAIKSLSSPDVDVDSWLPSSHADVFFVLEMDIGPTDSAAADVFDVIVATPEGLRGHATSEVISERSTLVLSNFDWPILKNALSGILERCQGKDWPEVTANLRQYFHWEYENYVQT